MLQKGFQYYYSGHPSVPNVCTNNSNESKSTIFRRELRENSIKINTVAMLICR